MPGVWKSIRAGLLALVACVPVGSAAAGEIAGLLGASEHNRLFRLSEQRPMIFFVAKGPADSCGRGCNEWIAAVGRFDTDTARRFRDFLGKLNGRNLPIYFHSPGGSAAAGVEIGYILREKRMTAGVGRTETKSCRVFDKKDLACQDSIAAGQNVEARLIVKDAQCHSACVMAFAGASQRHVAPEAFLGVHASRLQKLPQAAVPGKADPKPQKVRVADFQQVERRYYLEMGIDPALADFSAKISHQRIYVLHRAQIMSYGFEFASRSFETPWMAYQMPGRQPMAMKSVTIRSNYPSGEFLTLRVAFFCTPEGKAYIGYRRELPRNAPEATTALQLNFAGSQFSFRAFPARNGVETGASDFLQDQDTLGSLAAAKTIEITEKKRIAGAQAPPAVTTVSADGLKNALGQFRRNCVPDSSQALKPKPDTRRTNDKPGVPDTGTTIDKLRS